MKDKNKIFTLLSLGVIPFLSLLVQFFIKKKNLEDFVTYGDLFLLFGIQLALFAILAAKIWLFNWMVLQ